MKESCDVGPSRRTSAVSPLPYDHVIFTDLDGVEGVLVDLNTKQYFGSTRRRA